MECLFSFYILAFCTLLLQVSSVPIQESEAQLSNKHYLSSDKESLLKKVQTLENELQGRPLNEILEDDESEEKREKESDETFSDREQDLVASLLKRVSTEKAGKDADDPYKKALAQLLDEQIESGKFKDEPFDDDMLGQDPEVRGFGKNDLMDMLDSISMDDLKELLSDFDKEKRVLDEGGDANTDGDDGGTAGNDAEDDEDDDFLKDVTVADLKALLDELKGKQQGGRLLTPGDLGKAVSYLLDHLSVDDLQTLLAAVKERKQELEEDKMSDKELAEAIESLLKHISVDELQRILSAVKMRKKELATEADDGLNNRGLEDHVTEADVMDDLMDFLAGLSIDDLQRTILAVHRKKQAMKEAVGKVADEYLNDASKDEDGDNKREHDDATTELGPCAQEKQDILEQKTTARLANKYYVGSDVPNCNGDGYYAPIQCSGSMCYCVDINGATTGGEAMIWQAGSLICTQEEANPGVTKLPPDSPTDDTQDDGETEDENPDLEKLERSLLEMLKEEKRHQEAKVKGLNM